MNATARKHLEDAAIRLNQRLWDEATKNANAFVKARNMGDENATLAYTPLNMEQHLDTYYAATRENANVIVYSDGMEEDFTKIMEYIDGR